MPAKRAGSDLIMVQKIQYYASDLSYLLDIGEIQDMHVATTDSGRQVLRITCGEKKEDDGYRTVKAKPEKKAAVRKSASLSGPGPVRQAPQMRDNPETLGEKLMVAGKNWLNKKDKPQFMKDAGF